MEVLLHTFLWLALMIGIAIILNYIYGKLTAKSCDKCFRYYLSPIEGKCSPGSELYKECHRNNKSCFLEK